MALFVDLDDDEVEPPQHLAGGKVLWPMTGSPTHPMASSTAKPDPPDATAPVEEAREPVVTDRPNWNSMTEALGCYP